jgi:glucose-1-phosphate adenylyltransferase
VGSYTLLEDVVALPNVRIGRKCRVTKAIIDKNCDLPDGTVVGEDPAADAERFYVSPNGVVLITPEMLGQEVHHVR